MYAYPHASSPALLCSVYVFPGPGGYVAAIKAAQLGLKVACAESRGSLGGTCLNVGCIPSKALLNASHHYHDAKVNFAKYGIDIKGDISVNLPNMMAQKAKSVKGLTGGIEGLFKKNKVDYLKGHATITGKNELSIKPNDGSAATTVQTNNIIIATGSVPATLPGLDVDEKTIVTSTGALELTSVPKHLVVVGGGVIGLEMGSVWSRLGSKVTVVEYLDRIVPGTDTEIATNFKRILEKQHIEFKMGTKVNGAKKVGNEIVLSLSPAKGGDATELKADIVLVATGRRPNTAGLGLENVGIKMKGLQVETDAHFRTNVPNIYAIGDVIAGPMLAHKAEEEGIAAVEIIAGKAGHVNYGAIPGVIYTHPEVATVGQSEDDLKKSGQKYKVNKFPFMANSRARTNDDAEGLVKVIVDSETDRLLGVHIIGPNAGELIAEAVLGLEYGASAEDLARTCHAHPTLSEAIKEACMAKPIHF
jgi:dihydrolipoamide dehydrogenase